jgi:hypothetical protein
MGLCQIKFQLEHFIPEGVANTCLVSGERVFACLADASASYALSGWQSSCKAMPSRLSTVLRGV